MRMRRKPISKYRSVKKFVKRTARTKGANVRRTPERGGWRL